MNNNKNLEIGLEMLSNSVGIAERMDIGRCSIESLLELHGKIAVLINKGFDLKLSNEIAYPAQSLQQRVVDLIKEIVEPKPKVETDYEIVQRLIFKQKLTADEFELLEQLPPFSEAEFIGESKEFAGYEVTIENPNGITSSYKVYVEINY